MIIPITRNPNNRFTVARLHYSLDPEKNTPEWLAEAKRGMPENGFKREYEIDYSFFAGKPFYPEFTEYNIAKQPLVYRDRDTLYRGWDFGFHRPCVLITSLNQIDQWLWLKVILGQDEGILDFGKRVRRFCLSEYPGAKYIDACDIAGSQMNDKSEQTSIQVLNALGIYPQSRKQEIKQGAEIIRQKLKIRVDGNPGILVCPTQTDLIDGMKGGLHYPDVKEGQEKEVYEKDGFYDHVGDCERYLATEMFTIIGQTQNSNEIAYNDLEYQWRDGRPRTTLDPNEIESFGDDLGADPMAVSDY